MKPAGLTSENWLGNNLLLEQLHIKLSKIHPRSNSYYRPYSLFMPKRNYQ